MTSQPHTFLFADLAGFTALTEAHGDERAADIATAFCADLNRLLPEDAEDLKMLGDACLVRAGSASDAVELGLRLTGELAPRHGFPDVRVGMHTGPAVSRGGDWFGAAVNIAARVVALAGPGDVLLSAATWATADALVDVVVEDCGLHELRHVTRPVRLYRARRTGEPAREGRWVVDPVCRMQLDPEEGPTSMEHQGTKLFFCSALCAGKFARSPDRYLHHTGNVRP